MSSSGASGHASYSIDVGSCSNGQLTGTLKGTLDVDIRVSGMSATFTFRVTQSFENVCETQGNQTCVNGQFIVEASGSGDDVNGGTITAFSAWQLDVTWDENGTPQSASTKGGIKATISGNDMGGSIEAEYLLYAKNAEGKEVSFVLSITYDSMGNATWKYRGSDGEASCQISADGSGSCVGPNGMVSWTSTEYDAELKD